MAKRSDNERDSEWVKVEEEGLDHEEPPKESETVRLMLMKELRLKYTGPVSGKLYDFSGAGSVLEVDKADVEIMLAKIGGNCCPGSGIGQPQPYFAVYKEG